MIPTALAFVAATLFTFIIPASRTKEMLLLAAAMLIGMICLIIDLLGITPSTLNSAEQIMRIISIVSLPSQSWLPSNWVAHCLQQLLEPGTVDARPEFVLLFCSAAAFTALGYMVFEKLHGAARTKAVSIKQEIKSGPKHSSRPAAALRRLISPQYCALLGKEYRLCTRDLTQALQIVMLLGLCILYLYNLKIFQEVESLPEGVRLTWQQFLLIGNVAIGAFVITAICTRFVYPSISLEGPAFWIIASSPMRIGEIVRAKFWFWLPPISLLASAFFAVGAYTIGADFRLISLSILSAVVICYGIVGMGIGMGAFYANFNWEHASELAASFGGFAYMLLSIALILGSLVPNVILILIGRYGLAGESLFSAQGLACALSSLILLCALNYFTARLALKVGEYALLRRME
jgi:ABC-2 type transport system permease protein